MALDFELSDEQRLIQASIRELAEHVLELPRSY